VQEESNAADKMVVQDKRSIYYVRYPNLAIYYCLTMASGHYLPILYHSCHHLNLVDALAHLFNSISKRPEDTMTTLPVLHRVNSGEMFGLVSSDHTETFGGLLVMKDKVNEDPFMSILEARAAEMSPEFENGIASQSNVIELPDSPPHLQNVSVMFFW